jgi:hypothetical protein
MHVSLLFLVKKAVPLRRWDCHPICHHRPACASLLTLDPRISAQVARVLPGFKALQIKGLRWQSLEKL